MTTVYSSGDYAGIKSNNLDAYYGFEHTNESDPECDSEDWCFVASFGGAEIVIPFGKLGAEDMFNVKDCLLHGIAKLFETHCLTTI